MLLCMYLECNLKAKLTYPRLAHVPSVVKFAYLFYHSINTKYIIANVCGGAWTSITVCSVVYRIVLTGRQCMIAWNIHLSIKQNKKQKYPSKKEENYCDTSTHYQLLWLWPTKRNFLYSKYIHDNMWLPRHAGRFASYFHTRQSKVIFIIS